MQDSTSSEDEDEVPYCDTSSGSEDMITEDEAVDGDCFIPPISLEELRFVLIELSPSVYYTAMIMEDAAQNATDVKVSYLRKSAKVKDAFVFPHIPDVHMVAISDIKSSLPMPKPGQTKRLKNLRKFSFDFGRLDVR
jgi:hypothetical protein